MPLPRELVLDRETEEALRSYIDTELNNHYAERAEHIEDLKLWQKDYWAKPSTTKATFPFTGAATIVIPLDAIAIEAVHARAMTQMFALDQFVEATAVAGEWSEAAHPVESFLDHELLHNLKIRKHLGDCFLEAEKFGTMIGKVGYQKLTRRIRKDLGGGLEQDIDIVYKNGAVFDAVPDSRFLMPNYAMDPQTAPWCGEEHTDTPYQLMQMELSGIIRPGTMIDPDPNTPSLLKNWATTPDFSKTGNQFDDNQKELDKTKAVWPKVLDYVELWMAWDVDGSRVPKEIVVLYHPQSHIFLSIRYNWLSDGRRPYQLGNYMPVEHRWRGIGICKMNEQFQREVTTQHRQRLDNATLANMRMLKVHKLSGYGPKEPIFPGKMWFLDDMTWIEPMEMHEVYASSYNDEQATLLYSQQRTGVNETTLGMPQVGTPGTATSDLARIQEGNKKFDFIFANYKEFTTNIIYDVAAVVQEFGPRNLSYFDKVENGQLVRAFFQMPASDIRDGLLIQLAAVGQQKNKIIDRQNWQQIAVMLQQYYTGMVQLAQMTQNPQITGIIVQKGFMALTEAMRQILVDYDTRNVERLIVGELNKFFEQAAAQTGGMNGPYNFGTQQGGNGQSAESGLPAGMDNIAQILTSIGANGGRGIGQLQ